MPADPSATASFFAEARLRPCFMVLLTASAITGCSPDQPVVVERVPKDLSAVPLPLEQSVPAPKTDRMLAAIIPHGDQAYFFKVTGPKGAVATLKPEFLDLVQSISFEDGQPHWTAPDDWTERPASGLRLATFDVPSNPPLEVSVMALPLRDDDLTAYRLANVNRWRGQMGLAPIDAEQLHAGGDLDEESVELTLPDGTKATLVNLVGHLEGGMTPPFAGGGFSPRAMPREPAASSEARISYDVPVGWKELGPEAISQASFVAGESKVTVTPLPASNTLIDNINRWRGQVGLPAIGESRLDEVVDTLTLGDDQAGDYVVLVGPRDQEPHQAILGVVAVRGDTAWFVKMIGDAETVLREQQAFESFAKSLRFPDGTD